MEFIHSDVCGHFPTQTICKNAYFVTSIDDFSQYAFVYLISEKRRVFGCFKTFKNEVEKQLEMSIKILRSDHGGEYYGRFT